MQYPDEVWKFDYQQAQEKLLDCCDRENWAADGENRRSVTFNAEPFGTHSLDFSVVRQTLPALIAGEANSTETQHKLERMRLQRLVSCHEDVLQIRF